MRLLPPSTDPCKTGSRVPKSPFSTIIPPFVLCAVCAIESPVLAADLELFEGESFEEAVESLLPGDTLTIHEGTYADAARVSIGVIGTADKPVVIQGAPGEKKPLITRSIGEPVQNTINIEGAKYLTIRGLEISSNGGDGVNISGNAAFVTLEDLEIHDIAVGINFRSSMHHITVRRNHIYDTSDSGEGMYVGCNYGTCSVSHSIFENNWIHDTLNAEQGDGIEIKHGSHSNIIRNNVIHDTHWPCILLYGTAGKPRNIVEGNIVWNCGDSGIQVAADAVIRNNIILESPENSFNSQFHQGVSPQNLEFVHNTVVGGDPCLRMQSWKNKNGMVFANNAIYCPSRSFKVSSLGNVAVSGNVFLPAPRGFPDGSFVRGRTGSDDFVDLIARDLYPASDSPLRGAGDARFAADTDFNGIKRTGETDAGAYNWSGPENPGWKVRPGIKQVKTKARK